MIGNQEDIFHLGIKALLQNPDGDFLLLKKKTQKGFFWDLPGGRVHKCESPEVTLKRELLEEIGEIHLTQKTLLITFPTDIRIATENESVGLILSIYLAALSYSFTPILSSEHEDFGWFSLEQIIAFFNKRYPKAFILALEELKYSKPY